MGGQRQRRWTGLARIGDERARRSSLTLTFIALAVVVGAIACADDSSSSPPVTSTASTSTSSAPGGADPPPALPTRLQHRPVLAVLPPTAPLGPDVLPDQTGEMSYRLGPGPTVEPAYVSVEAVLELERWQLALVLAPGAAGIDTFNNLARVCHANEPSCPTGQIAMVLDGTVISAPRIQPSSLEFEPFTADQIRISGSYDEAGARALAAQIRGT